MEDSSEALVGVAISQAPDILRFLRGRVSEPTDAHDLLQELYLRLLKLKPLEEIRSPNAYLFRVAANLAYEHHRRLAASPPQVALDDIPASVNDNVPEADAVIDQHIAHLSARLNDLPPRIRSAIIWHHQDGYTCEEIGEKLSVVRNRVKKYLIKGLAHCRATQCDKMVR